MVITDYKVSESYSGRDISSLSDRPNADGLSAAALKARFDQLGKEVIPNYNDLIDLLNATLFASSSTENTGHTHNADILVDGLVKKILTAVERAKLEGIESGAEVNQFAFSKVKVGSNEVNAVSKTDTFELAGGLNVSIDVNPTTKVISLSATGELATDAIQSYIVDVGNYFTSLNVEGALQEVGAKLSPSASKTTPVDADTILIADSEASNVFKKISWANLKATLKTYFDTLYNLYVHPTTHAPSIIEQDASNRFVTDAEKTAWNAKQEKAYANAGAHNSIYRGKFLGTTITAAQYLAISSGTFDDLFVGDYWTIGGINWRIAGFNYFYNVGDTALTVNHAVIVPDTQLYAAAMNPTNTTDGGYTGSQMRTTNLASAISTIESIFAGHVITHRQLLVNAATTGKANGWAWFDAKVELMNEVMVYGSSAWGVSDIGNGYNVASSNGQLPLFALRHDIIHNRQNWWLRDVVSAAYFAYVSGHGVASSYYASHSSGVRPAFCIS